MKVDQRTKLALTNSKILPNRLEINVKPIRILIADGRQFVCQRLEDILEPEENLEIVAIAHDGAKAINLIESLEPDMVLLDLELPVLDSFEALEIIVERFPACKVLALSSYEDDSCVDRVLKAGAKACLFKSIPADELINAIHFVDSDRIQLSLEPQKQTVESNNSDLLSQTTEESDSSESNLATSQDNGMFRQKSLEKLSSPERLDQLMQIVDSKSWIPLSTLGFVAISALVWSIFGRIPITVEGAGVLVYPSTVVPVQTKSSGQLVDLKVDEGDVVEKGDVIATIDRGSRKKELARANDKLAQLRNQNFEASSVQLQRSSLESQAIEQQRQSLEQKLRIIQDLTPTLREKGLSAIQSQRQTLQNRLQTLTGLAPTFKQRFERREKLFGIGAISEDSLLEARQQYSENLSSIDEAQAQLKDLEVQEADALQQYLGNINEIENIKAQIQDLDSKQASSTQQDLESTTARQKEIQQAKREIAQIEQEINSESQVISTHSGKILELTVGPGQVIEPGTRLASINTDRKSEKLMSVTYFPVKDGKKVQKGMDVQITPKSVKRERFGGIVGTVKNVSSFPSTTEAASKVIGNPEIIKGLVSEAEPVVIQVSTSLEPDSETFSGYEWSSSSGPKLKISSGTTTTVRVEVEERAPITFVLPILRSVSGIY